MDDSAFSCVCQIRADRYKTAGGNIVFISANSAVSAIMLQSHAHLSITSHVSPVTVCVTRVSHHITHFNNIIIVPETHAWLCWLCLLALLALICRQIHTSAVLDLSTHS